MNDNNILVTVISFDVIETMIMWDYALIVCQCGAYWHVD